MKLLDGTVLYPEIKLIDNTIDTIQGELTTTKSAIMDLIALEDDLKGQAGEALRSFYNNVHIPFLNHFEEALLQYQEAINETEDEFLGYDNDKSVFIDEELLINEVDKGLDRALEITDSLVTEANDIMSSVSDIIGLAPLSMQEFAENVMRAKSFIYDIVIANLYNIDAARESALVDVHESLKLIHTYLNSVEISFKDKAAIECFDRTDAMMLPYLAQDDLFDEIAAGIKEGLQNYGVDFIDGLKNMSSLETAIPPIMLYNLLRNSGNLVNVVKYSFNNSVINGDAKSRTSWSVYALLTIADTAFGSHGVGNAPKIAKWGNKGNSVNLASAIQQTEKWKPIMEIRTFSGIMCYIKLSCRMIS